MLEAAGDIVLVDPMSIDNERLEILTTDDVDARYCRQKLTDVAIGVRSSSKRN